MVILTVKVSFSSINCHHFSHTSNWCCDACTLPSETIRLICWACGLTASGALRCEIKNGGCWKGTQNGRTYSACIVRGYIQAWLALPFELSSIAIVILLWEALNAFFCFGFTWAVIQTLRCLCFLGYLGIYLKWLSVDRGIICHILVLSGRSHKGLQMSTRIQRGWS